MDDETRKIWELIGALSDAHWRRAAQPGVSALHILFAEPYRPESEEELAIWTELTAPHNHPPLRRFVEDQRSLETNDFAGKLNENLLMDSTSRWERRKGSEI